MTMTWEQLLCAERLTGKPAKHEAGRSPFISDHDKIVFSGAFRRLARKTQVHPLAANDHIHNRMTHSLEVACVGRTLAIRIGEALREANSLPHNILPTDLGDIVQSTCLAHDIGNPPFGHTGEEAIKNWFAKDGMPFLQDLPLYQQADLKNFEGNAQGLRILTTTEYYQFDGGMRLTYATLAAFIKYPWCAVETQQGLRPKSNKYGIYQADLANVGEIAGKTGLLKKGDNWYCRHPLVYLMEAADDFCYGLIDLEDGLEMGLLRWDDIFRIIRPVIKNTEIKELEKNLKKISDGRKPGFVRGKIIDAYIEASVEAFMANEKAFLQGAVEGDLISLCRPEIKTAVEEAKNYAKERIFAHPRKVELEIGAYDVMARLLSKLVPAAYAWYQTGGNPIEKENKMLIDLIGVKNLPVSGSQYEVLMAVIDFVSGMTDNYAVYLSKQFGGMGESRY
jgi:dGTPase